MMMMMIYNRVSSPINYENTPILFKCNPLTNHTPLPNPIQTHLIILIIISFSSQPLFKQNTRNYQGGSMPNTSSASVPFLFSSSMQSIRSRRPSCVMGGGGAFNSGSGLLQQLGSGMVRLTSGYGSGAASPIQQAAFLQNQSNRSSLNNVNRVRKCPSLNITFTS